VAHWQVSSPVAVAWWTTGIMCWATWGREAFQFYLDGGQHPNSMAVKAQVLLLEGICVGVKSRNMNALCRVLERILEPIVQHRAAVVATSASGHPVVHSTTTEQEMQRIILLLRLPRSGRSRCVPAREQ
jgi:hypothetical protein